MAGLILQIAKIQDSRPSEKFIPIFPKYHLFYKIIAILIFSLYHITCKGCKAALSQEIFPGLFILYVIMI